MANLLCIETLSTTRITFKDGEIYKGNDYYDFEGLRLCEDCYDNRIEEEKRDHMRIAGDD